MGNLRHVILRDAGHSVPRYKPEAALQMFKDFLENGQTTTTTMTTTGRLPQFLTEVSSQMSETTTTTPTTTGRLFKTEPTDHHEHMNYEVL